jgi:GATA-binding protein
MHLPNGSDTYGNSPPHPTFNFRAHSPGGASTSSLTNGSLSASNGVGPSHHLEPPSLRREQSEVTELKTRVSELEVINDLFRGRVSELERLEKDARDAQLLAEAEADRARKAEHTIASAFGDAKRRIEALEVELASGEPRSKKLKVDDYMKDDTEVSQEISPLSTPA